MLLDRRDLGSARWKRWAGFSFATIMLDKDELGEETRYNVEY
jgi:hypothetical protein